MKKVFLILLIVVFLTPAAISYAWDGHHRDGGHHGGSGNFWTGVLVGAISGFALETLARPPVYYNNPAPTAICYADAPISVRVCDYWRCWTEVRHRTIEVPCYPNGY